MISLTLTKEGDVYWVVENNFSLEVEANIDVLSRSGDISVEAAGGNIYGEASTNIDLTAGADFNLEAINSLIRASASHTVDCSAIKLGSASALEPGVLGYQLAAVLLGMCGVIAGLQYTCSVPAVAVPVMGANAISGPQGLIMSILAQKVKLE